MVRLLHHGDCALDAAATDLVLGARERVRERDALRVWVRRPEFAIGVLPLLLFGDNHESVSGCGLRMEFKLSCAEGNVDLGAGLIEGRSAVGWEELNSWGSS